LAIKQFSFAGLWEGSCSLHIAARRHGHYWVQQNAFEPTNTISPHFHHPLGTIDMGGHDDPSFGGEVEIPELVASQSDATSSSSGNGLLERPDRWSPECPAYHLRQFIAARIVSIAEVPLPRLPLQVSETA
jgi:hypothetical protein